MKIEKASGIRFADMFHVNDERVPVAVREERVVPALDDWLGGEP